MATMMRCARTPCARSAPRLSACMRAPTCRFPPQVLLNRDSTGASAGGNLQRRPVLQHAPSSRRGPCAKCSYQSTSSDGAELDPSGATQANPLEVLRATRDIQERARLIQQLDGRWTDYFEQYQPSPQEEWICAELGLWSYNVMLFAVQHPDLVMYDLETQIKPCIRSLKHAGLEPSDIWFLLSKKLSLFEHPMPLQRWLDFLGAYDVAPRDSSTFLLRAPSSLYTNCTLHQAGQVVSYLRMLGVKPEYLMPRVVCLWPDVLMQNVQDSLEPVVTFLSNLGLEVAAIACLVCVWPEILLSSTKTHLAPFIAFLQHHGCSTQQAAKILQGFPHLVKQDPEEVFGARLAAIYELGLTEDDVNNMLSRSSSWLTAKGAPYEQVAFLKGMGFSTGQVRYLVHSCPAILSEKPLELQRKVEFLQDQLSGSLEAVLEHPTYLGVNLMQVIGPRHAFVTSKGLEGCLVGSNRFCSIDLTALVKGEDVEFVDLLRASINEYEGFRTTFEEEYTNQLSVNAAKEFQDELKKLGIYEGA